MLTSVNARSDDLNNRQNANEYASILVRNAVFAPLKSEELALLARSSRLRCHGAGEVLFDVTDPSAYAHLMVEGVVGEFGCGPDGTTVLLKVFAPPGLFGDMELFWGWPHFHRAEALTDAKVLWIEKEAFQEVLRRNSAASFLMAKDIAGCVALLSYLLQANVFLDIETRLANLLVSFSKAAAASPAKSSHLPFPLSQPMLARCVGSSDRSISRVFAKWKGEKWFRINRKGEYQFDPIDRLFERADDDYVSMVRRPPLMEQGPNRVLR